jgi:hypothetical protein
VKLYNTSSTAVSVHSSELGPPTPAPASECPPTLPEPKRGGGQQSPAGEGAGGPNSDDLERKPGSPSTLRQGGILTDELGDDFDAVSLGEFLCAAGQLSALKVSRQASNLLPIRHFSIKIL